MRPAVAPVAAFLATRMSLEIAPKLEGFSASNAGMIGAMLQMMSEEWDRAASRLVEENAAIRLLLRRAAEVLGDSSFGSAAAGDDADLRVSSLDAANDMLRRNLTAAHERVEGCNGADARALEAAIWDELRASVARRRISSANF
jgi:cytosine/adenosine deaminase-related metal-dependent hydrolase